MSGAAPASRPSGAGDHLRRLIRADGPITVARFMAEALGHPTHGYYASRDPFGLGGDFVTAPEISQMFGELMGLWCGAVWGAMGSPTPFRLVELGPGRGTLMADALRALQQVLPACFEAADVHLVETSPTLRSMQKKVLGQVAVWHESFEEVPAGPALVVANELFDALPVHQLVRRDDAWRERVVMLDDEGNLAYGLTSAPSPLVQLIPAHLLDAPEGSVFETSPAGLALAGGIAARIARDGGAALVIDYGHAASGLGDTLQAVKGHRFHPVLEDVGEADLTAHVDFASLAQAAQEQGAVIYGPLPQGRFLQALGIEARAEALLGHARPDQADGIRLALRRLTHPKEMGALFKAMAFGHPSLPALPGFTG